MKVMTFKLISGDEVVGQVEGETDEHYIIQNPRTFNMSQTDKGINVSIFPLLISSGVQTIKIDKEHILFKTDTHDQAEKQYLSSISGIAV